MGKKNKEKKLGTCDNDRTPHPKRKEGEQCSDLCRNWVKVGKQTKVEPLIASGGWCAPTEVMYDFAGTDYLYDFPTFSVPRGGISYPAATDFTSQIRGGDHMGLSISRLAQVASLVAFGVAVFGGSLFGAEGLELVSAGLFLHVGGDIIEDVVAG